ncbi:MAG: glycerophosphodiester phosphodiesterase [Candidatus Hydrogenedentota bacterium]
MRFGYLMCAGIVPFLSLSSVVGADETRTYPTPPRNGGIYVIAHRGAHQGIPENTLEAYQKAIDLGCDFVEIDVRTTKDG